MGQASAPAHLWLVDRASSRWGLVKINWDHFEDDAYNAGHEVALLETYGGKLEKAYAMNSEDQFLEGNWECPDAT